MLKLNNQNIGAIATVRYELIIIAEYLIINKEYRSSGYSLKLLQQAEE